jgi:hypothetical protein
MAYFRKKPVVIEAFQWKGFVEVFKPWIDALDGVPFTIVDSGTSQCGIEIDTLEGKMTARPSDWIIKGVNGEFYPCKPDIFAATYEPAEPRPPTSELEILATALRDEWKKIENRLQKRIDADRRAREGK